MSGQNQNQTHEKNYSSGSGWNQSINMNLSHKRGESVQFSHNHFGHGQHRSQSQNHQRSATTMSAPSVSVQKQQMEGQNGDGDGDGNGQKNIDKVERREEVSTSQFSSFWKRSAQKKKRGSGDAGKNGGNEIVFLKPGGVDGKFLFSSFRLREGGRERTRCEELRGMRGRRR